ncbi:MAG TPA: class I SAM-dependent methyltransferase [Amycolatopsis sp.]|nr:class I SAM-dependent methyltransferase [Amycolatopsis sp.]
MDQEYWDERYSGHERMWSGAPNGALVAEVTALPPGRALDLGCGEGADALWLAGHGWQVDAVDISQVALDRAIAHAATLDESTSDRVAWSRADLTITSPASGAYDLVSAQYFPLPRQPDHAALRGLLAAVAPGGTLLVTGHDLSHRPPGHDHPFDPDSFYQQREIAGLLDDAWTVLVDETRPRTTPAASDHTHDTVLRARRRD